MDLETSTTQSTPGRWRRASAVALASGLAIASLGFAGVAEAAPSHTPLLIDNAQYDAITAVSSNDVWALGSDVSSGQTPLVEHWDGSTWTQVPAATPAGATNSWFAAGTAISANNIWAFGTTVSSTGVGTPLAEHWNGKKWRIASLTGSGIGQIFGSGASGPKNVWAVGANYPTSGIVEHYDGTEWQSVTVPVPPGAQQYSFFGVAVHSATNVWIIGNSSTDGTTNTPLAEHYNGTKWSIVKMPTPTGARTVLFQGATTFGKKGVVAAGAYAPASGPSAPLVETWNGKHFVASTPPAVAGATSTLLTAASAVSASDVWAVGVARDSSGTFTGVLEHWDGTDWTLSSAPTGGPGYVTGVAAISSDDVWAAGWNDVTHDQAVSEHWDGSAWTVQ